MSDTAKALQKYCRLADYMSATQIYLKENAFLEHKLEASDIKERILGHWGTSPGINLIYGATNISIVENPEFDFMYIVGPGHGFPAYQAGTFLDRSLSYFYPDTIPFSKEGFQEIIYKFSVPYGYPSHINPQAPGAILEGGELGYSLSTAFGAVMDEPNLIAVTLIGDGEAETGPLSAAWQLNKLLNLQRDGAVLPILHLNGYKISGPTMFSTFTDEQLKNYFTSLGYIPFMVDEAQGNIYEDIIQAFALSIDLIEQEKSKKQPHDAYKPALPVIILKTSKGRGTIAELKGSRIEGNSLSHQVIFSDLKNDKSELALLEKWLKSYKIDELISFDKENNLIIDTEIDKIIPDLNKSLGANIYARRQKEPFTAPDISSMETPVTEFTGQTVNKDTMHTLGEWMTKAFQINTNNFRLFSPDETYSNHLQKVFEVTARAWNVPAKPWEKDLSLDGRVVEILSEHSLFGMLQGYVLTGRQGVFVSYEAFAQIVSSMADQYVKFKKQAQNVSWRNPTPSLNIILTSLLERQDHNGFSHQNPSFIATNLDRDLDFVNVYYPADANIALHTLQEMFDLTDKVNIMVAGKRNKKIYLNPQDAKAHVYAGASIWEDFSQDNPDIVLATAGDYITNESLEGLKLFKKYFPDKKLRFVNFNKIDVLAGENMCDIDFLLTNNKPVVFNYHGYASTIKKLVFDKISCDRILINGFMEQGSTTTPLDLLIRNNISRFHTVLSLIGMLSKFGMITFDEWQDVRKEMNAKIKEARDYAKMRGKDIIN